MSKVALILIVFMSLFIKETYAQARPHKMRDTITTVVTTSGDTILVRAATVIEPRNIFKLDSLKDRIYEDTTTYDYIKPDTSKSSRHIVNLIAKNLFKSPTTGVDSTLQKISKFNAFAGRTIDSVVIVRNNIFPENSSRDRKTELLHKSANSLNYLTRESTIKRYLLFKKGDIVTPEDMIKSEALLRSMSPISKAFIWLTENENGTVTAYVSTTDSWTLTGQLYYRVTNNGMLKLSELDFMGTGNRLDVNGYFNIKKKQWFKALEVNYFMPNVLGRFIEVNIGGGYGRNFHSAIIAADKFFVMPNDFAGGIRYSRRREEMHIAYEDIFVPRDMQLINAWIGQSINISKKWGDNMFYTAKAEQIKFFERPYNTPTYSPFFHNSFDMIMSAGFYKEKFYRGNLIYGYGVTESVSYGYKADLIGGYRIGEFDRAPYIGTNLSIGNMIKLGYVSARVSFGTFLGNKESLRQTKIDAGLLYFTRLKQFKADLSMRQFLNINYTSGIRSLEGNSESLSFQNNNLLNSVSHGAKGTTRLRVNPETVFFTPMHISGFKFALFGFTDFGTIGYSNNPFSNKFYAVAGCGVRIRNESLIFKTIQFRVMISIKGDKEFRNNLFYLNSETPLRANRYIPTEPKILKLN